MVSGLPNMSGSYKNMFSGSGRNPAVIMGMPSEGRKPPMAVGVIVGYIKGSKPNDAAAAADDASVPVAEAPASPVDIDPKLSGRDETRPLLMTGKAEEELDVAPSSLAPESFLADDFSGFELL